MAKRKRVYIKTQFTIKDLENLSGVKAHTIRIWEKRYSLLTPTRTDTNIRKYDSEALKKLLNVTFLYNHGFKISKIAKLNEDALTKEVNEISVSDKTSFAIKDFKASMFDFDDYLFSKTYLNISKEYSFREIFRDIFIPLLTEIGILWHAGTIDPSHERFISELIKQKTIVNISREQDQNSGHQRPSFALFLPHNEIHEIGLLYANYEIIKAGYNSIYLGMDIPIPSLNHLLKHHEDITFVTYLTVTPENETLREYVERFNQKIKSEKPLNLWVMGGKIKDALAEDMPENAYLFKTISELTSHLEKIKKS